LINFLIILFFLFINENNFFKRNINVYKEKLYVLFNEINKRKQLLPDKIIAGPVWLPPMPGKAPITLNTKENNENVIMNDTKLKMKEINKKAKVDK